LSAVVTASAVPVTDDVRVGLVLRGGELRRSSTELAAVTRAVVAAGIDHLTVGDHVSFSHGNGADGLIQATALLAAHPDVHVQTGVYLLALRHPATVARQLSTIAGIAPGRLEFGVGVGGDDPAELRLCGIDPRTRGARTSEALALLRALLTGDKVSFRGRFFTVEQAAIRPAVDPAPPILIGGRSDAALERTGRLGDGWLGLWVSPRRFAQARNRVREVATAAGREHVAWRHTLQLWAGIDTSPERARARLRPVLASSYGLPFERFERYCPCGRPEDIAAALTPYVEAGCRRFNIVPEAASLDVAIDVVGKLRHLLAHEAAPTRRTQR
jgi:alkanesulfonate monooxygenase SsuD/methylene tetrahydromethanopterin reductase-like flavin-dependent oxidoreductase (luciferase family)